MAINGLSVMVLSLFLANICTEPIHFKCREGPLNNVAIRPKDCSELPTGSMSGVYTIQPNGSHPYRVYCDMDNAGGGWTVFQRRRDGTVEFYLNWTDYENGFGFVDGEHWLGNAKIAKLTEQKNYSLRVDMKDFENSSNYSLYNKFMVDATENYMLEIGGYRGQAGDAMNMCNGQQFSTKDRDNDNSPDDNCAIQNEGAWWYNTCHEANLNGRYMSSGRYTNKTHGSFEGLDWKQWKGFGYSLSFTEMKVRPNS